MANVVMGAVGAGIGFMIGGPTGALYGAQLGFTAGNMMMSSGSQTVQGPRIGEIASQSSREGIPRPIVFGVARPIGGNIIASGRPVIRVVREKVSSGGGGKGGGGGGDVYQEREEVYRTYAIRICEGPVNAVRRVWRDNKLVYDSRAGVPGDPLPEMGAKRGGLFGNVTQAVRDGVQTQQVNNAEFLKTARFYLGGYDQMPDPALQAEFGVNNVPAHRGTCYMVQDTEDLTPRRGSIPQYVFEVERGEGFALTSKPYPIFNDDVIAVSSYISFAELKQTVFPPPPPEEKDAFAYDESSAVSVAVSLIELKGPYISESDETILSAATISEIDLLTPYVSDHSEIIGAAPLLNLTWNSAVPGESYDTVKAAAELSEILLENV